MVGLDRAEREGWERDGFVLLRAAVSPEVCREMLGRAVHLAREQARGRDLGLPFVLPEPATQAAAQRPEDAVGKIFRLHPEDPVFEPFSRTPALLDRLESLLGPAFDCFLSQFIFKNPGALGQPWHQDSYYFPFEPDRQVGVWVAVTAATRENGPLWVLPGSHREPVHEHVPDRREHSQIGYVEIVDHDMSAATPVLMDPGDVLLFDSHLMHRSTDNGSEGTRAAMVYHYSPAGTLDGSTGFTPNRWVPVRRPAAEAD
ncbi:MAG: phytanoyl-CoA dioxygenase family protein [bacterium]|nr:phytanoyl-CoA dioxygenase family protein [bacterium]